MKPLLRLLRILPTALLAALVASTSGAASPSLRKAVIPMPDTNGSDFGSVANDAQLVYTLDDPLTLPASCTCNSKPFADFHVRFYAAPLHATPTRLAPAAAHLFYTAPRGFHVMLFSVVRGWVVYESYPAVKQPDQPGPWTLLARNLVTGKEVALDSAGMEGLPSVGAEAASDGRTVVWTTWTHGSNRGLSVVRTYDTVTGQRHLVTKGGSPSTWSYSWAQDSRHWTVFEKDAHQYQQIVLADLATGRTRALTSASGWSSEPSVSGDVVAWKDGLRFGEGKGVVIYNMRSGVRQAVRDQGAEAPKATAGRYVLFSTGDVQSQTGQRIRLYDAQTGTDRVLFEPAPGWNVDSVVRVGGRTAVYGTEKPSGKPGHALVRVTVVRLP